MMVARIIIFKPIVNTTKELVQRFLLIGNRKSHINAKKTKPAPQLPFLEENIGKFLDSRSRKHKEIHVRPLFAVNEMGFDHGTDQDRVLEVPKRNNRRLGVLRASRPYIVYTHVEGPEFAALLIGQIGQLGAGRGCSGRHYTGCAQSL
jgi:hypothetical protein